MIGANMPPHRIAIAVSLSFVVIARKTNTAKYATATSVNSAAINLGLLIFILNVIKVVAISVQ